MATYSEETIYRLYNDTTREYLQASEDFDGLGLVEVRRYDNNGRVDASMVLTIDQVKWLMNVLPKVIDSIECIESPT